MKLKVGICSSLTKEVLDKLKANSITTVNDVCRLNHLRIVAISTMTDIKYELLCKICQELMDKFAPPKNNSFEEYQKFKDCIRIFETGNLSINRMLEGGIYSGEITEVSGHSATGKTQFCLALAASVVADTKKQVLYIDTDLSFSIKRVKDILRRRQNPVKTPYVLNDVMSRIKVCQLCDDDLFELLNMIESMYHDLELNGQESLYKNIDCLIIDSLASPLYLTLNRIYSSGHFDDQRERKQMMRSASKITSQLAVTLQALASRHSIAVVVVNSLIHSLVQTWNNACAVRIRIEKPFPDDSKRVIEVIQSDHLFDETSDKKATYNIKPSGIRTAYSNLSNQS